MPTAKGGELSLNAKERLGTRAIPRTVYPAFGAWLGERPYASDDQKQDQRDEFKTVAHAHLWRGRQRRFTSAGCRGERPDATPKWKRFASAPSLRPGEDAAFKNDEKEGDRAKERPSHADDNGQVVDVERLRGCLF